MSGRFRAARHIEDPKRPNDYRGLPECSVCKDHFDPARSDDECTGHECDLDSGLSCGICESNEAAAWEWDREQIARLRRIIKLIAPKYGCLEEFADVLRETEEYGE